MFKRLVIAAAVVAAAAALTSIATANATEGLDDQTPSPDSVLDADWNVIESLADGLGSSISEAPDTVVDDGIHQLDVYRLDNGGLCLHGRTQGKLAFAGCGDALPARGLLAHYAHSPRDEFRVVGLVDEDVSSVIAVRADGSTQLLDTADGAFWWTEDQGAPPVRLEWSLNGVDHHESQLFQ